MNARLVIPVLAILGTPWVIAQNVTPEPVEDPVQAAIREFNRKDAEKSDANEVTVVLPAPGETPAAQEPVLVTGKPPRNSEMVGETPPPGESPPAVPIQNPPAETSEPAAPVPQKGLAVRVEKLQAGTGSIDPSQVKLLAPFPAKPLAQPPAGWRLEASENAPPFTREVELSPGKKITLTVRPHLLIPDTNGANTFMVSEPGFEPSLGYRQDTTVGAILSQSIRQLDDDSKALGSAIDNLQQLLVSLPKPEPVALPAPEPAKPAPTRKR
jgi:hypothetical protein